MSRKKFLRPFRMVQNHVQKAGMPPGTVMYLGEKPPQPARITLIDFDANVFKEQSLATIEEAFEYKTTLTTTWINIDGLSDISIVEKIGEQFDLHPLVLEDIVLPSQRPKAEDYGDYLFVISRMMQYNRTKNEIVSEQVSMVLRNNCLITFQETIGDVFDQVRGRLRANKGRVRKLGTDYLVYALVDAMVDHYFSILDTYGERIEDMEDELLADPTQHTLAKVHEVKRELMMLRKYVWPMRELASVMQRSDSELVTSETKVYFRDVYDHTIQIIETIESQRDVVAGLLEIYLSSISNRMNAQMKMLTLIATIFMPLSFLTGVYGMNFKYFPELESRWTYPYGFWALIAAVATTMIIIFKRNKWL